MKTALLFLLISLSSITCSIAAPNDGVEASNPRPKWEYKYLGYLRILAAAKGHGDTFEDGLNALGAEGWELVAIESRAKDGTTTGQSSVYYFKRRVEP